MIRVNLLTAEDRPGTSGDLWRTRAIAAGGLAIAVAAAILAAWWFWSLHADAGELTRALADAEAALVRLAPALETVRGTEERQADLAGRLAVIETLHAHRDAPVRLLDRLSRALPEGTWLSEVRQEPAGVVVRGHAETLETVSDYAAALDASGGSGAPVEIVDSQREERFGGREVVSFEVRMSFPAGGHEE